MWEWYSNLIAGIIRSSVPAPWQWMNLADEEDGIKSAIAHAVFFAEYLTIRDQI
jgi:hypothetical protein